MAWVATVEIDADKTNVGTVTAVFTDSDGTTFPFQDRVDGGIAGDRAAFVTRAKAALTAWQQRKTRQSNAATTFTNALNS